MKKKVLLSLFPFQDLCSYKDAMFLIERGPIGKDHLYKIIILSGVLWVVLMSQVNVFYSANKCSSIPLTCILKPFCSEYYCPLS